jgi:hypothetical protein
MQHYLAPTRLLDWTENLLVALYFAVRDDALDGKADAAVWLLNARRLNYYSSGTTRAAELAFPDDPDVIARSVLCRVREREEWFDVFGRTLRQCRCDRADYRQKRIQDAIAAVQVAGISVNDVDYEKLDLTDFKGTKGTQRDAINLYSKEHWGGPESLYARMRMPVAVYAPRSNRRIRTQSGVFTLHGGKFVHKPTGYKKREVYRSAIGMPIGLLELDAGLKKKRILKWLRIPKNDRVSLRRTLAQIGVTDATLFPELDYQSKYLITRWTYREPKEEEDAE